MTAQNLLLSQPQLSAARATFPARNFGQPSFIAISAGGRRLIEQSEIVGPHLQMAVIEGEAGVGKQALAQLLHSQSQFAGSNFNRSDAREWLLSDVDPQLLTGFTYLDRVDLLAPPHQALLLRVLKSLQNRPDAKFALVASSERSLRHMASDGQYLPDLAFRLSAISFAIPPLRERREDIAPLAAFFLDRVRTQYHLPCLRLAPGATALLLLHQWPANTRELASTLESAALNSDDGTIRGEDLPVILNPLPTPAPNPTSMPVLNLDTVILNHLHLVLHLNHGNKLKTARQLGISRSTLYRMLDADSPRFGLSDI